MQLSVTCRHEAVGEAARKYAERKVERLGRYIEEPRKVEVVLDGAKDRRFTAELIVSAPRSQVVVCHAEGSSATAAFDEALEKMERQLREMKSRARSTRRFEQRRRAAELRTKEEAPGEDLW